MESGQLKRNERRFISTGLKIALPRETYGHILSRSSLAAKGIDVGAGLIDSDYRGVVKVLLINNSKKLYKYKVGDRVAQIVIQKLLFFEPTMCEKLDKTERNCKGFGSSGSN